MRALHPRGPYYIGGYSHGGRVVLEMAQQLKASGEEVGFVGIIDTWPCEGWSMGPRYWARWLENFPRWLVEDAKMSSRKENLDRLRRGGRVAFKRLRRVLGIGSPRSIQGRDRGRHGCLPPAGEHPQALGEKFSGLPGLRSLKILTAIDLGYKCFLFAVCWSSSIESIS